MLQHISATNAEVWTSHVIMQYTQGKLDWVYIRDDSYVQDFLIGSAAFKLWMMKIERHSPVYAELYFPLTINLNRKKNLHADLGHKRKYL